MNVLSKLSMIVFAAALLVFTPNETPLSVLGVKEASAQKISSRGGSRAGAYLSRVRRSGVSPAYSFKRSGLGVNRAGIYRNVKHNRFRDFHRNQPRHRQHLDKAGINSTNGGDKLLIERRRQIEKRNARVAREFDRRNRKNRIANRKVFADPYFYSNGSGFVDVIEGDGSGVFIYRGQPCPKRHNCGYRLYSDGTGPRIITPGQKAEKGLPEFDGLNGPQVITLD